jgi:ProP effector
VSAGNGAGSEMREASQEPGGDVELGINTPQAATTSANPQELVAALAQLFPAVFVTDRWAPHKPLKVGIGNDLLTRGVLRRAETRVLSWYVARRMYQLALAAGGPRYDLDGNVAGEVSAEHIEAARAKLAALDAKRARKAEAVERAAQLAHRPKGPAPYPQGHASATTPGADQAAGARIRTPPARLGRPESGRAG